MITGVQYKIALGIFSRLVSTDNVSMQYFTLVPLIWLHTQNILTVKVLKEKSKTFTRYFKIF